MKCQIIKLIAKYWDKAESLAKITNNRIAPEKCERVLDSVLERFSGTIPKAE